MTISIPSFITRFVRRLVLVITCLSTLSVGTLQAQTLEGGLNAGANAEVLTIAPQADGKILIGGNFLTLGGQARSRIARFNADGTIDSSFNPSANSTVNVIRVQPDGRILVGGGFTTIGGAPRARLARLNPDGSVDAAFNPGVDNLVRDLAVQPDGKIVVVGSYTQLAGFARSNVGRLNADGTLDPGLNVAIAGTNTPVALFVRAVALQADGRILIGGNFATVAGQSRNGAARLTSNGTLDPAFNPNASSDVLALATLPDGKFLIGGSFSRIGTQPRNYLARFNADGSLDPTIPAPPNAAVVQIAVEQDGGIIIGGFFTEIGPVRRNRIARLNPDTALNTQFAPDVSGAIGGSQTTVYAIAIPGPGQIILGGSFSSVAGVERNGIARLGSPLPVLILQPTSFFLTPGAGATLTVAANGENLRYQWKRDSVDLTGATNPQLALSGPQTTTGGNYTVAVSNSFGTVTSAGATLTVGAPPATTYQVSTVAGTAGQSGLVLATGPAARFNRPLGITVTPDGTLFVMDGPNNVIREVATYGFAGTLSGIAGWGLALDASGNIYVADADTRIARITRAGAVSTFAGAATRGSADGPAGTAQFRMPRGVAVDAAGNVYVADSDNFTIRKITPSGVVSTLAGQAGLSGLADGTGPAARFNAPWGIAVDGAGTLFVADRVAVRKVSPSGVVTTLAPAGTVGDAIGVAADNAGNVFVTDVTGHTIRKISATGVVTTIAGLQGVSGSADGIGSGARFSSPWNLTVDAAGALYITDNANHTIRKATPDAIPLAIAAAPTAQHAVAGSITALGVSATGTGLAYQWKKDGVAIPGATHATHVVGNVTGADMGYYSVVVSSAGSAIESAQTILTVETPGVMGRLINVATRGLVQPDGALTPGFVLRGNGTKRLVVRGVGPTLLNFGLGGALPDPRFELTPLGSTTIVRANDDWGGGRPNPGEPELQVASAAVGAFSLTNDSKDAAAIAIVDTAISRAYTVRITGNDAAATGLALAEVYDTEPVSSPAQLTNVSTRGFVGAGANALVPGFVIGGNGPLQLLIRAVGPGLAPFGVTGLLADPQISVVPLGRDTPIATNDNWGGASALSAAFAAAGAFALPTDSRDAVVLVRLPPGGYTVIVSGVGNTTGNALVEIYDVP